MSITTPKITKIIRMTEFDLLRTNYTTGNMYMCLDSQKLYYDESSVSRVPYDYVGVKTVNDLHYNITPSPNTTYYCWEDNSLWLWMNKWITLWSDRTYPSAYVYDDQKNLNPVYRYDQPLLPADDNGLLKDGSVVIRDRQRIIKGKIFVDDGNDNLVISSFLGGGFRVLPNGRLDTDGELFIGDEGSSFLRSEWNVRNHESYVDYTEHPEDDNNPFKNDTHRYLIFHEGNLDASKVREISPLEIYNKLLDKSLPNPFEFNVRYLNGLESSDFALKSHKHVATDITDFNTEARKQAGVLFGTIFNSMTTEGITANFNTVTQDLKLSANNFKLTFTGGATGQGTVEHLTDTSIKLTVDPSQHTHQNYIDRMDDLQDAIDALESIDPSEYYKKKQVDDLIASISPTDAPTPGYALKVNKDGKLPGTALYADSLSKFINIEFTGDVTGQGSTDFSQDIQIELSADSLFTSTPTPGKALLVDDQGNIPANALSASKLDHTITIELKGDVTGTGLLDTSLTSMTINTTLQIPPIILTEDDIGTKIPELDSTGKIPASQLPEIRSGIIPMGNWNPSTGAPSSNPTEGDLYIATNDGTYDGTSYWTGDWCVYLNGSWNFVNTANRVLSVNGKTGTVNLTYSDVDAISDVYINYNVGDTIPANRIVVTSDDGVIEGASVSNLTKEFNLLSDANGDVEFSTSSKNTKTDGSKDLDVQMTLTETGFETIKDNCVHTIYVNGRKFDFLQNLKFDKLFSVTETTTDSMTISFAHAPELNILNFNDTNFNTKFSQYAIDVENTPLLIYAIKDNYILYYIITQPGTGATYTYNLAPNHYPITVSRSQALDSIVKNTYTLKLVTAGWSEGKVSCTSKEIVLTTQKLSTYITSDSISTSTTAYTPTADYNPTTKKYVDDKISERILTKEISVTAIGDITVNHGLDSSNILVQFRNTSTKQQVFIDNTIKDNNNIVLHVSSLPSGGKITAIIYKF